MAPTADGFPPAASYISGHGLVKFDVGGHWLLDVTLDNGTQGITRSLEPIFRRSFIIEDETQTEAPESRLRRRWR